MAEPKDTPDARELLKEELARDVFPVSTREDFRIYLSPGVHRDIHAHASVDVSVEICGVLVGRWCQAENGPFVSISEVIRCEAATSKHAEVTFTHEAWAVINEQMDTRFSDLKIVGWYHSHPDFDIFLSDRDRFIHEHFYSGSAQVAYVVDPVRKTEGVFRWQDGKLVQSPHYWVGDRIVSHSKDRDRADIRTPQTERPTSEASRPPAGNVRTPSLLSIAPLMVLLLLLGAVLLGYFSGSRMSGWHRVRIIQGVAAHFAVSKVMRFGLRERLIEVDTDIRVVEDRLRENSKSSEEQVLVQLNGVRRRLNEIGTTYCLSDEESRVVEQIISAMTAELGGLRKAPSRSGESAAQGADSQKPKQKSSTRGKQAGGTEDPDLPNG